MSKTDFFVKNVLIKTNSRGNFQFSPLTIGCFLFCVLCDQWNFSFQSYSNGTSTSGLTKHMLHAHGMKINTERDETKQRKLTDIFISDGTKKIPVNRSYSKNSDEKFILSRRIALWLCKDLIQFKTVENKGFRDLWSSLHIGIPLPSRKTISVSAIDDMYSCMKTELVSRLLKSGGMCTE